MNTKHIYRNCYLLFFILWATSCNTVHDDSVKPISINQAKNSNEISPNNIPPGGCPDGYEWNNQIGQCEPVNDCSAVQYSSINTSARNSVVSIYGQDGGIKYDQLKADTNTPAQVIYSYSAKVWNYIGQIENAIKNASNAYSSSVSSTDQYNSTTYLSYLNSYLNPLKTTITNDNNLNSDERNVLLQTFQAISDNFYKTSNLIENNWECFPPIESSQSSSSYSEFEGGVSNNANSFLTKLKTIVNFVATILVPMVQSAAQGSIYGATIGSFVSPWGTFVGFAVGGVFGGAVGFMEGFINALNGKYICVFWGTPGCSYRLRHNLSEIVIG
jgi:hypothetical protein